MTTYLIRRALATILILLCVAVITFLLIHAIPGSPWDRNAGRRATSNVLVAEETLKTLDRRFGLDQPLGKQFIRYLIGYQDTNGFQCGYICGNLGPSLRQQGRTVQDILFEAPENGTRWQSRFGYSLRMAGLALIFTLGIGIPVGIYGAVRRDSAIDRTSSIVMAIGTAMPNFVLGLLIIIVLGANLHLISIRPNWNNPADWLTPAFILAIAPIGMLARITRSSMLEAIHGEYVNTARAKGLDETSIIIIHVLKNASIPILTHLGPVLFELIAASFIIEVMFSFPGFGLEYFTSITQLDYTMIMALTLLYGLFIALANLLTDLLYSALDPRIRLS